MTPQEIAALFMEMEQRLIASLKRNLSRHRKWEQEEGFSWPAWQAEKIRSLESYRRQNRKIIAEYRPVIDAATAKLLYDQYEEGYNEETEALEQLLGPEPEKKAQTLPKAPPGEAEFFGTDKAKMDALIEDINATFHKAESATFRMMDDVYRRTIYRAETALSGGETTLWKAVDMATADFLRQGITCIRYKNGRLVNIASYAEMALRTAATRAKLRGEAAKRQERGLDTVLVSQYGACSETCLPWQGRAYIDDVWGGFTGETDGRGRGLSKDGSWYPLLSTALEGGLFHPNCRHTLVDWKKGVTREPETLDRETCLKKSKLEQQQRAMERKVRKYKRLREGTLDPEKVKEYGRKVREAQGELREFIREHGDVFSRKYQREKNRAPVLQSPPDGGILVEKAPTPLTEAEQGALSRYFSSESYGLNESLREGIPLTEFQEKWVQELDGALEKMPTYEGTLYRSLDSSAMRNSEAFLSAHVVGNEIIYSQFISSSTGIYDDTMDIQMIIQCKSGRDLRIYNPNEQEILFQRNTRFLVTKKEGKTIWLTEI